MHRILLALVTTVLAIGPLGCAAPREVKAETPEEKTVMTTLHQFVDGFNLGDSVKAQAVCADAMSIIDEFPPHEWHGSGAGSKWMSDYDADAKKNGISEGVVTLVSSRHIEVTGDRAYVVATADYAYKQNGERVEQIGSTFTFALQKTATGWVITGWAWSTN